MIKTKPTSWLILLTATLVFVLGCGKVERSLPTSSGAISETSMGPGPNRAGAIQCLSLPDVKHRIRSLKGKIVVVDLWAMW